MYNNIESLIKKNSENFFEPRLGYKEDPFAYKIALLYFIANGISAAMSTTLSPISETLSRIYSSTEITIWYINSCYTLYYLLFNLFANYLID